MGYLIYQCASGLSELDSGEKSIAYIAMFFMGTVGIAFLCVSSYALIIKQYLENESFKEQDENTLL